jgi:hypothetical protein
MAVPFLERDHGTLPVGTATHEETRHPARLPLALAAQGPDGLDLHVEDPFDGEADLRLRGLRMHDEGVGLPPVNVAHRLLGDQRPDDHVIRVLHGRVAGGPRGLARFS